MGEIHKSYKRFGSLVEKYKKAYKDSSDVESKIKKLRQELKTQIEKMNTNLANDPEPPDKISSTLQKKINIVQKHFDKKLKACEADYKTKEDRVYDANKDVQEARESIVAAIVKKVKSSVCPPVTRMNYKKMAGVLGAYRDKSGY